MEHLYGVGSAKNAKYGDIFVGLIKNFCAEHGLEERGKSIRTAAKKATSGKKHEQVGMAFNDGQSIALLSEEHGVKVMTILKHLTDYLNDGEALRLEGIVEASGLSARQQDQVMQAFKKVGPELLKPVYEKLNKAIGYDELRIMQLYYLAQKK